MTSPAVLYGQGISFPPRVGPDGGIVRSAGETNVRESVVTILRTRPGERVERPAFGCGLDRYLFEPNTVATLRLIVEDVQRAVTRWEPRIRLEDVSADVNGTDPRDVDLTLVYSLIATGVRERLRMTLGAEGQDQP